MTHDTTPVAPLVWNDSLLLGFAPMDGVHEEFVSRLDALRHAAPEQVELRLQELEQHLIAHFSAENTWMSETSFPAKECHIDEHAAVLKSVAEVRELVATGNLDICKRLVQELNDWFPGHADYLDSALAHWMVKQKFGGKPLVLRRQAPL